MANHTNPVDYLETEIEKGLKWKKVEEIEKFPLRNFEEAKEKISSNEFSLGLDYTASNTLATWLYGKKYALYMATLGYVPYIGSILSVIFAISYMNFWLLFGIPLCLFGLFTSNPYYPKTNFYKGVANFLTLILIVGLVKQQFTTIFLTACFVISFWTNWYVYNVNWNQLREVVLNSEKIFIYLYQEGNLGVQNNANGESFWNSEALLVNYRRLFRNPRWPAK